MHAGRRYPINYRPDLGRRGFGDNSPPRKMFLRSGHSTSTVPPFLTLAHYLTHGFSDTYPGTAGTVWSDLEILSTVGDYPNDYDQMRWRFNHPTVANSWIDVYWTTYDQEFPPGVPIGATPDLYFEFYWAGIFRGDKLFTLIQDQVFANFTLLAKSWNVWEHLADPTIFEGIPDLRIYAGSWPQQPEWHPYRYNPLP